MLPVHNERVRGETYQREIPPCRNEDGFAPIVTHFCSVAGIQRKELSRTRTKAIAARRGFTYFGSRGSVSGSRKSDCKKFICPSKEIFPFAGHFWSSPSVKFRSPTHSSRFASPSSQGHLVCFFRILRRDGHLGGGKVARGPPPSLTRLPKTPGVLP